MEFPYTVKVAWGERCMAVKGCESIEEVGDCVVREMLYPSPVGAQIQAYSGAYLLECYEYTGDDWEVK